MWEGSWGLALLAGPAAAPQREDAAARASHSMAVVVRLARIVVVVVKIAVRVGVNGTAGTDGITTASLDRPHSVIQFSDTIPGKQLAKCRQSSLTFVSFLSFLGEGERTGERDLERLTDRDALRERERRLRRGERERLLLRGDRLFRRLQLALLNWRQTKLLRQSQSRLKSFLCKQFREV